MTVLIAIILKSLFVVLLTLTLLKLMKSRSAAERSWVAHIGLLALVIMAFAPLVLPKWTIEAPALFSHSTVEAPAPKSTAHRLEPIAPDNFAPILSSPPQATSPKIDAAAAATAIYAVPAAILLILTLLALLRLFALRARAEVLVDAHWLSALARAQRRMGFKHGTALLTSNELASPVSWGLMRPVILLNSRAVEAAGEAEAIIAHELAHVARMDWIKLLLARFATAMFWFNPFVWLLAREAHQLREEAADDSVLASDISDTDYAQLLVGVARHECPGLLLGAHGVAPSKSSLARRVARVLDGKSVRGPVARSFGIGVFAGAVLIAAPLAALTVIPRGSNPSANISRAASTQLGSEFRTDASVLPQDLPHLIVEGVSTSVGTARTAISPGIAKAGRLASSPAAPRLAMIDHSASTTVVRAGDGATVSIDPEDSHGRRLVAIASNGTAAFSYSEADGRDQDRDDAARHRSSNDAVRTAIEMKAVGLTADYAAAIRSASPALRNASLNEILALKSLGITPAYIREIVNAGFGDMSASQLQEARAVGLSPDYMRAVHATGVAVTLHDLVELRAMGVHPSDLARIRAEGPITRERIRAIQRDSHGAAPPRPPEPPAEPADGG